jgi:FAD/FMN-containing dehydrogenase
MTPASVDGKPAERSVHKPCFGPPANTLGPPGMYLWPAELGVVAMDFSTLDGGSVSISDTAWSDFVSSVRGQVVTPSDADYDIQRVVWNAMIDRRPAAIVRCAGSADVRASVLFAHEHGVLVSVRGGGHNVAGKSIADDALMIDLSAMRAVHVDPALATVRVAGGCLWSDVDRETQSFGLATPGGTVSHTGVGGLTLGGGLSWQGPLHGFTCDNLVSVDLVTAGGDYLRVSEREHPDLFWALRGGGGNFGVATAFELQLHPTGPLVYGGPIMWPAAQAREILSAYAEVCQDLPDELSLAAGLIPSPEDMQPLVAIVAAWFGPIDQAEAALAPVRALQPVADLAGPIPYVALQSMLDAGLPHGLPRYWKSGYFTDLPGAVIDSLADADDRKPTPISVQLLFHQHGAATRVGVEETAFPHRAPMWDFDAIAQWSEAGQADAGVAWARRVWDEVAPYTSGVYVNHLDADDKSRVRQAYGPNYDRLVSLKQKYDPENFFRLNNNILPA